MKHRNLILALSVLLPMACTAQVPPVTPQPGFVSPDEYTNAFFRILVTSAPGPRTS